MRTALLLAGILLLNVSVLLAQSRSSDRPVKGTYQIEVHDLRAYPLIPDNIEEIVVKNRKKTEINYVQLTPNVRIKIWPESTVNLPGYTPPAQEVVHYFGVL